LNRFDATSTYEKVTRISPGDDGCDGEIFDTVLYHFPDNGHGIHFHASAKTQVRTVFYKTGSFLSGHKLISHCVIPLPPINGYAREDNNHKK
jgi:hypothetical protein